MDPASAIIGIASGAAGLVALCIQTVTFLSSVCDSYKNTQLAAWDLISSCEALQAAWTNVHIWLKETQGKPNALSSLALEQLKSSMSRSKFFMELLQKDLERLFPGWTSRLRLTVTQRSVRLAVKLVQHQDIIRAHCERISHQSTNLVVLLSTIKLPSVPLQETVLESFRPRFRKDEETAWTIIQTRPSTVVSRPSSVTSHMSEMFSAHSILSTSSSRELDSEENIHLSFVKFPFQDELLSSPVYRRTMLKMLRDNSFESPKSNRNIDTNPIPRTQVYEPVSGNADYDGILVGATRVLRDIGDFSTSCRDDLEALRDTSKPLIAHLPRHLPISNIICRQELSSEEKFEIDQKFLQAVKEGNAGEVVNLLDSGADINAYESGSSPGSQKVALSLCLENIDTTPSRQDSYFEIANLLLLYNEILSGKFVNPSCTILHACVKHGIAVIIGRLSTRAQIFGIRDSLGNSPLHLAVQAGERGLHCIEALCKISTKKSLRLGEISDCKGRSALQLALENRLYRQALLLIRLGGAGKVNTNATDNSELPSTIYIAFERRYCQPDKGMSLEDLLRLAIEQNQLKAVRHVNLPSVGWWV